MSNFLTQNRKNYFLKIFPWLYLAFFICAFFVKSILWGLVPIPFNLLTTWFFPYNLGGWQVAGRLTAVKGGWYASDAIRQMYPWRDLSVSLVKAGIFPLWNPYSFSGSPLFANIQSSVFYPPALIFYLTSNFNLAWTLYLASAVIMAAVFMYLFLRSIQLHSLSSLLGAVAFSASGYMTVWLEWGIMVHEFALIPLSLLALNNWFIKGRRRWLLLLSLSLTLTVLAGYPQGAAYNLLIVFFWFAALVIREKKREKFKKAFPVIISLFLALGITAVQWLPTAELYFHSAMKGKASQSLSQEASVSFSRLASILSPDFFGNRVSENFWGKDLSGADYMSTDLYLGSLTFMLAVFALLNLRQHPEAKLFSGLLILGLILSLKSPVSALIANLGIPVISTGAAANALQIAIFSLASLGAIGMELFFHPKMRHKYFQAFFLICGLYLLLGFWAAGFAPERKSTALQSLILPLSSFLLGNALILARLKKKFPQIIAVFLIILTSGELLYHSNKILPFSSPAFAFPAHPLIHELRQRAGLNRVLGFWENEISTNFHTFFRLYSAEGYDPLYLRRYGEFTAAGETGELVTDIARSDADITQKNESNRNRLLDLTSVKYIPAQVLDPNNYWEEEPLKYDPQRFKLVWQSGKFKIYENLQSLPRVKLYFDWQVITSGPEIIKTLFASDFDPFRQVVVEKNPGIEKTFTEKGKARITYYSSNRVEIETESKSPGLLLLTDSFYPGWKAVVDSQPLEILRTNYSFRSLPLPAGKHQVSFLYRPASFQIGSFISYLALGIFILLFVTIITDSKQRKI